MYMLMVWLQIFVRDRHIMLHEQERFLKVKTMVSSVKTTYRGIIYSHFYLVNGSLCFGI